MTADGIPEKSELDTIRRVAEALELDFDEEKKRRERIFIEIDPNKVKDDSIETFLDIDPGWSNEQKKKHLTQLMAKWSPRVTSLPEGKDRENAQKMVNLIGEARKKLEI